MIERMWKLVPGLMVRTTRLGDVADAFVVRYVVDNYGTDVGCCVCVCVV